MEAEISKDFEFSASHLLDELPEGHQCSRLHGHNYRVRVSIVGTVMPPGFVIDYGDLAFFRNWIDETLDHRHLNDIMVANPTAENVAAWMAEKVVTHLTVKGYTNISLIRVAVSETSKTWAIVSHLISGCTDGRLE